MSFSSTDGVNQPYPNVRRQLHLATPLFFDRPLLMANSSPKKVWRVMPSVAPGMVKDCSIEFLLACGVGLLAGTVSKEDV